MKRTVLVAASVCCAAIASPEFVTPDPLPPSATASSLCERLYDTNVSVQ